MIQLIQSLEQSIPARSIRLQTTIKRLSRTTAGDWELASDAGSLGRFDHVVLSTPTSVTAKLLEPLSPVAARELASIQSASVAIVVLGTRKADIDAVPGFGFVVPPIENRRILAVSFSSEKFAGRASADQLIVRVFIGGVLQSELLAQDDQSLIQIAREELADLIGLKGTSVFEHVVRWTDAMPQYTVGHLDRVATIEQGLATFDSLHLAGNGLYGVGIAPVVQTAHRIAAKITGATTI
jgi:oxygen-dependent protoporphyrinogen oxidase